jgi:hypothetical protein
VRSGVGFLLSNRIAKKKSASGEKSDMTAKSKPKSGDSLPGDEELRHRNLKLPPFNYTSQHERAILEPLKEATLREIGKLKKDETRRQLLCQRLTELGTVEKSQEVVGWVTIAARCAHYSQDHRRPFARVASSELERYVKALQNGGAITLSRSVHRHLLRHLDQRVEQVDGTRSIDDALVKTLDERVDDLIRFHSFLGHFIAETALTAARHLPDPPFQARGSRRKTTQLDFGIDLSVIFWEATGTKPTSAYRDGYYGAKRDSSFSSFVEAAMRPTGLLGKATVEYVVSKVMEWWKRERRRPSCFSLRVGVSMIRDRLGITG